MTEIRRELEIIGATVGAAVYYKIIEALTLYLRDVCGFTGVYCENTVIGIDTLDGMIYMMADDSVWMNLFAVPLHVFLLAAWGLLAVAVLAAVARIGVAVVRVVLHIVGKGRDSNG